MGGMNARTTVIHSADEFFSPCPEGRPTREITDLEVETMQRVFSHVKQNRIDGKTPIVRPETCHEPIRDIILKVLKSGGLITRAEHAKASYLVSSYRRIREQLDVLAEREVADEWLFRTMGQAFIGRTDPRAEDKLSTQLENLIPLWAVGVLKDPAFWQLLETEPIPKNPQELNEWYTSL